MNAWFSYFIRISIVAMVWLVACGSGKLTAQQLVTLEPLVQQGVILVNGTVVDNSIPQPLFQGVWRGVPEAMAVFQLQRTTAPRSDVRVMLDRVVEAGLAAYIDANIRYTRAGVVADKAVGTMVLEMNAMIQAAVEELHVPDPVVGLTLPTVTHLLQFASLDWSNQVESDTEDKYYAIYKVLRSQRIELDRQIKADLLPLGNVLIWGEPTTNDPTKFTIGTTCGTVFDDDNFLCALDLQLAENDIASLDPLIGLEALSASGQTPEVVEQDTTRFEQVTQKIRKRDRWLKTELDLINQRLTELDQRRELWQLRDQLEDIEDRIVGLELEVREQQEKINEEPENPLASLSELTEKNISVHFARNSSILDREHHALLNEVFEQLARQNNARILITGFADATGPAALNYKLSELRAKAVRSYFLERGITQERLLINYYGASKSDGREPGERRVEIEWLPL